MTKVVGFFIDIWIIRFFEESEFRIIPNFDS